MKQNDWLVANINNPTYDSQDFRYISGLTLDNTQMLSKEDYLKSDFIRNNEAFKDQNGSFDEKIFQDIYEQAAQKFSDFSADDEVDNYQYSMWDVLRPDDAEVKNPNFTLSKEKNPQHISIGVAGINEVSNPNKSIRELAQSSKIYDPATGKYLDKSVNDLSLFKDPIGYFQSIFGDPLVYATYDQDTEEIDPVTGNKILHKKGEWKVNEDGEYYVEKLNGRSLIGKQVVSALDYLTPEDSNINQYDFFDSDDLEKSVGGTIAKNIAAVIPLFIPYVNAAYSGLLVGREIGKSLPMMYGMLNGLSGSDNTDSKLLNTIAAYGQTFTGSTSDYAQENVFSFENFGNLMSDVALQWGQQKFIAQTFSKLTSGGQRAINSAMANAQKEYTERTAKTMADAFAGKITAENAIKYMGTNSQAGVIELLKSGKWVDTAFGKAAINKYVPAAQKIAESRMRTGQDLSLVYMAMVSNTDVYESVLEHGGTPFEAASIALGSMIGMFSVDKYLGLGEMFFNDGPARRAIRESARKSAQELMTTAGIGQAETQTKKGILGLIQKGVGAGQKAVKNYRSAIKDRTLGFTGKALGEGLEEVSEELVADLSKTLGELAGKLGYFSQSDYGAWENAFDRYVMSFLGGAAGGGLFYGVDAVKNRNKQTSEFQTDLTYLLRQGKKDEILSEINKLRKQGRLGSKTLSYKTTQDKNGNLVYLTADNEGDSQSQYIYDTLVKTINQLDFILNDNQVNLSEDEVFDKMVQGEYREIALSDFLKGDKEDVKDISYITRYQEDFQNLLERIVNKESEIQQFIQSTPDPSKRGSDFQEKLNKLKSEKQELLDERDYLFGEGSLGYVEKMLFAMDTNLSGQFMNITKRQYIRNKYGKSTEELTQAELEQATKEWEQSKSTRKETLDQAFSLYKQMEEKLNSAIQDLGNIQSNIVSAQDFVRNLKSLKNIDYDTKLPEESDEDYEFRNTKKDNETDEEFQKRKNIRIKLLNDLKAQELSRWINDFSNISLDENQLQTIQSEVQVLKKNLAQDIVRTFQLTNSPELTHKIWDLLEQSTLQDIPKLKQDIKDLVLESIRNEVNKEYAGRAMYDDFTWEGIRSRLEELGESPQGYLTYGDLYKILEDYRSNQEANGLPYSPEDYLKQLSEDTLGFDPNSSEKQDQANAAFLQWYSLAILDDGIREQHWTTPIEITPQYLENEVNSRLDDIFLGEKLDQGSRNSENGLDHRIDEIIDNLLSDPLITALSTLESQTVYENVAAPVIETISKLSSNKDVKILDFLQQLYQQYQNGETAQSFELTDEQERVLWQFIADMNMAEAFVNAASQDSSYERPVGHNKSINQFISNHKDIFGSIQPLPELSSDVANYIINELYMFQRQASNWINLSRINTGNKARKFNIAEQKYAETVTDFYQRNRNGFRINQDIDLLEGFESIQNDKTLVNVAKIEQLLYNNYRKALAKGVTLEQILDSILPRITNLEEVKSQLTSNLDENLDYSKLTSYDKLQLVISSFALSSKQFYSKLNRFISDNEGFAPLSIQESVAKVIAAQQADPELINKTLEYLADKLKVSLPVLKNTSISLGLGGSGKTAMIARMSSNDGENTWLCGPVQTQVDSLMNILPKGRGLVKDQLLQLALGSEQYEEFKGSFKQDNNSAWKSDGRFGSGVPGLEGNRTFKINDKLKINKIQDTPKLIIIDEATHFDTSELEIISKFAEINGSQLLLLGDDHQNGSIKKGLMMNLDREVCLAWRAPKLSISLRDNNIQESRGLQDTINLIDRLDRAFMSGNEEDVARDIMQKVIPNFSYNYYNKESFKGKFLTKELSDDIVGKLNGSIGFIGASTSSAYQKLIAAKGTDNVTLIDPVSVQGQEFDYVIVDKNWDLQSQNAPSLYFFLKDLYTMISRSREGTILIQNGYLNNFHSIENDRTGVTSIKPAIKMFRERRIPVLQSIVDELVEEDIPQINQEGTQNEDSESTGQIAGTNSTAQDLNPEESPIKDNNSFNQEETAESNQNDTSTTENITTPIRVYSNVSYSGIALNDIWTNNSDIRKDLGIFVRKGDIVREGKDKRELVRKVLQLKCIFNYGLSNWERLPKDMRDRFSKKSFEEAEYYISVEDPNQNNRLIGLTDLDPDKRTINGKVVTLVARITDTNGQTWDITLGGLANPQTWKQNESEIIKSIQKRIADGDPKSAELQEYIDQLHNNIIAYENRIAEVTKTNQEIRINTPQFSGLTTLVKSNEELRLQSIDPNSDARPFDAACQYAIKSDVYVLTGDIPGVNPDLKGKPVIYVSSNLLLDPSQLQTLYEQQKNDPSLTPQVRMIVLDNMGVSFDSLFRKKYKDIYQVSQGDSEYYFPFESEPMGLRMYKAMWNFRANLQQFLRAYNTFKETSGLSQDDIIKLCRLDNQTYNAIRGEEEYLSEEDYRGKVDQKTKDLLKPIWDFNDSLKDYRQFRLGYSSNNGAYIRKLTNLSEDGPYQGRNLNNVLGIYINPDLAEQYSQILDNLFNNVLEKIIPSEGRNPMTYITKELEKGWFEKARRDREIQVNLVDYSEDFRGTRKVGVIKFPSDKSLSAIPSIIVEVAKFLEFKTLNQTEFETYLQENPGKYSIRFGDEELNWWGIDQVFENSRPVMDHDKTYDYSQFPPGVNPYEIDPDTKKPVGIIDDRLSNLFGLMFHGLTSTRKYNDFTKDDIRATDADFKYGFFTDPVLAPKHGVDNTSALTITNDRLFGAKVYPGLPMIGISMDQMQVQDSTNQLNTQKNSLVSPEITQRQETTSTDSVLSKFMDAQTINYVKQSKISFTQEQLEDIQSVEDLKELVDQKIMSKFKKFWSTQPSNLSEISTMPFETFITDNGKLGILSLTSGIIQVDGEVSNIESAYWDQGHLIVKMESGSSFIVEQGISGAMITEVKTNDQPNVTNSTMEDLGTLIKQVIDNYSQPNNEDGLDPEIASQLINLVDRVVKKGRKAEDVSIETKNKIINQIQEALQNTDLESEINIALTQLKDVCKLN